MVLRYDCLLIDHDDTASPTTEVIHHPAHLEILKRLGKSNYDISLDKWFLKNFDPGVFNYYVKELGFSNEEMKKEYDIWREFTSDLSKYPDFFPNFIDVLNKYKSVGGKIVVVSHSEEDIIKKHYELKGTGFLPDKIYGWNYDETKRKPSPLIVDEIKSTFQIPNYKMLLLDDLKPGFDMAKNSGIDFAFAGWAHDISIITDFMRLNATYFLKSISDLEKLLFN